MPFIILSQFTKHDLTQHKYSLGGWRGQDVEDLVHPDLLIGHAVDDAVVARIHVPQIVSDGDDSQGQSDHQPQDDVEYHSILKVVLVGQVVWASRVTLHKQIREVVKRLTPRGFCFHLLYHHPEVYLLQTYNLSGLQNRAGLPGQRSLKCLHGNNLHHSTFTIQTIHFLTKLWKTNSIAFRGWMKNRFLSLMPIRISFLLSGGQCREWQQRHGTGVSLGHKVCWPPPSQTTPKNKCQENGPLPGVCVSSANERQLHNYIKATRTAVQDSDSATQPLTKAAISCNTWTSDRNSKSAWKTK